MATKPSSKKTTTKLTRGKQTTSLPAIVNPVDLTKEKAKSTKALTYATSLEVTNKESYDSALEEGKRIKLVLESVTSRKEEITKPMNEALKSTRSLFKPIEDGLDAALDQIRSKMTRWYSTEQNRIREEERKLAARVEKGTMKPETAVKKSAEIVQPEAHSKTEKAAATMRSVTKYRVVDKAKIPLEWMEPNMVAIKAEFRSGRTVAGVESYQEDELAIS